MVSFSDTGMMRLATKLGLETDWSVFRLIGILLKEIPCMHGGAVHTG